MNGGRRKWCERVSWLESGVGRLSEVREWKGGRRKNGENVGRESSWAFGMTVMEKSGVRKWG